MTIRKHTRRKFLVISYDDDQQQWFYDFVVAASGQAAVDQVCTDRDYVIAADALSPETVTQLAQSLSERTIESMDERERASQERV